MPPASFPFRQISGFLAFSVLAAGFAWGQFVQAPASEALMRSGAKALAHVETRWASAGRGRHYYADLTWKDARGQVRTAGGVFIGEAAYDTLEAAAAAGKHQAEILYDEADPAKTPVLVADVAYRSEQDRLYPFALAGLSAAALWCLVSGLLKLRAWRASRAI